MISAACTYMLLQEVLQTTFCETQPISQCEEPHNDLQRPHPAQANTPRPEHKLFKFMAIRGVDTLDIRVRAWVGYAFGVDANALHRQSWAASRSSHQG